MTDMEFKGHCERVATRMLTDRAARREVELYRKDNGWYWVAVVENGDVANGRYSAITGRGCWMNSGRLIDCLLFWHDGHPEAFASACAALGYCESEIVALFPVRATA